MTSQFIHFLFVVAFLNVMHFTYVGSAFNQTVYEDTFLHVESIEVQNEFIIIFNRYLPHEEHPNELTKILGDTGWELIERNNPSRRFPSDFALIKTHKSQFENIDTTLVKHILPQRRIEHVLKSIPQYSEGVLHGRKRTTFSEEDLSTTFQTRKLHSSLIQVSHLFNADYLWDKGYTGTGVKIAIFDTGLRADHPHFRNVKERTNWTDENTLNDGLGHGTFVAGVIASQSECLGFAPDADLHIFRVFTNDRVSYTSWFLDAFNYAIHTQVEILNLSIGGPDFMDTPFIEKVWEMSANNIIVVSAIGNDGPLYGTLNNPADQMDVIGVGGIDYKDRVAPFSSRGMTTWELPFGYGRVKPDVVAYGKAISGSRIYGGCRTLSGTSVASPVVAGAVGLLASTIPSYRRKEIINPASMKQALIVTADRNTQDNIFEQGFGKINILEAYNFLRDYEPHAMVTPQKLDLTNCPYMWPYCSQPIYHTGMPIVVNTTILNGMGVIGELVDTPVWKQGKNGHLLELLFTYPESIWPWSGNLGVSIRVSPKGAHTDDIAEGLIEFTIRSPPGPGEMKFRNTTIQLPLKVKIIPTPPRHKRILFDQFHNLRYPSGYFPRDALWVKNEPFDWNGDHPHTNFKDMYTFLRSRGYFVEVLGCPFTCFNASDYGTLLLVDPEEEYFPEEIAKLKKDIALHGLSLAVFADWYNVDVMKKIKFFDENTRQWWTPVTGGSNIPALNTLLKPYGIAFGDKIFDGEFTLGSQETALFASGTGIAKFPRGGTVVNIPLYDQTVETLEDRTKQVTAPVLGYVSIRQMNSSFTHGGRIGVFGDSSCLDSTNQRSPCFWLLNAMIKYTSQGLIDDNVFGVAVKSGGDTSGVSLEHLDMSSFTFPYLSLPSRLEDPDNHIRKFSKVLNSKEGYNKLECHCPVYLSFNKSSHRVEIAWDEVHKFEPYKTSHSYHTEDNINHTIPYIILFLLFVGLIILILRLRKSPGLLVGGKNSV